MLDRVDSRAVFNQMQQNTNSLRLQACDLENAASILQGDASLNLAVDPILFNSPIYKKAYPKVSNRRNTSCRSPG
jgi:hypothetical protein